MLINRKNYESFFLLYADDELCATEKILVEKFAAENPDLEHELDMLMAAVLPSETMFFPEKTNLYRYADSGEVLQENLLLLIDGELSETARQETEHLIKTNTEAKTQYELLLGTTLQPADHITFPDKQLLYRKAGNNVFIGRFARWAAAVIFPVMGLFFGISLFSKKNDQDIAVNTVRPRNVKHENLPNVKPVSPKTPGIIPFSGSSQKTLVTNTGNASEHNVAAASGLKTPYKAASADTNDQPVLSPEKNNESIIVQNKDVIAIAPEKPSEKPLQVIASVKEPEKRPASGSDEILATQPKVPDYATSFAGTLKNENKIFYMDENEVKRSKPFGIFRKVKRFVERTAQIKPGNTLRIAGFEFKGG